MAGGVATQQVEYSFGFFGIDEERITLHHDDVPRFLADMLANPKFQRIFTSLYPILFIDEYQDTDPLVMHALSEHFFAPARGPIPAYLATLANDLRKDTNSSTTRMWRASTKDRISGRVRSSSMFSIVCGPS